MNIALSLPGPSRTIIVEPLEAPKPAERHGPDRLPEREPAPAREPVPARERPAREPEKTPA